MAEEASQFLPAELVSVDANSDADARYIYANVKAPIMSGMILKLFVWLLEARFIGRLLLEHLKKANLISKIFLKSRFHEPPLFFPKFEERDPKQPAVLCIDPALSTCERLEVALNCLNSTPSNMNCPPKSFYRWTIRDYHNAYMLGDITPTMVAERVIHAIEKSLQPARGMGFFISFLPEDILQQAEMSTARYKKGQPLSVLDGVPVAVKDEIDCLPYPTTGGSRWLEKVRDVKEDAEAVKHLRECGALLVGKTNMHEFGAGTTNINSIYGAARNPYNRRRYAGGSSGGSAAVVAAGICPVSLGVDGGGSVRLPSALCGIVGFKGTFGRISSSGVIPINWSLGMIGIHAAKVEDALIMYAAIHGHLPTDPIVSRPPPVNVPLLKDLEHHQGENHTSSITLAKYTKWFEDCDKEVYKCCYKVLDAVQRQYGCKVIEVTVPEIEEMRLAHYITIGSECFTSFGLDYNKWGRQEAAMDVRATFALYSSFNNQEFLAAQRMRRRQMHFHMEIFKKADIIVTPTTGCTAKPITESSLKHGELNYIDGAKLVRYQIAGNFLGLPAISIPIGYDDDGMPIGLQLIGSPWAEATLLWVASAIEKLTVARQPEVFYDLLS